ncbi:hypothetical protein G6F56_012656 [Rhizopus delemar]|nr:hypothetical protein G6F56_012656 [Rhizopus delemar]
MSSERISQILPTVKCSDCGKDVQIRRLGDHLCSSQPPVPMMKDKYKPKMSPVTSPNGLKIMSPPQSPFSKDVYSSFDDVYQRHKTPNSFRSQNESSLDLRYTGTRKESLGNIYQQASYSTPTQMNNTSTKSHGALDTLMADLMNSMNDDIHLISTPSNNCHSCGEDFDYRDDVKTAFNNVS